MTMQMSALTTMIGNSMTGIEFQAARYAHKGGGNLIKPVL